MNRGRMLAELAAAKNNKNGNVDKNVLQDTTNHLERRTIKYFQELNTFNNENYSTKESLPVRRSPRNVSKITKNLFGREINHNNHAVDQRTSHQEPNHSPVTHNNENYSPIKESLPVRRSPRNVSKIRKNLFCRDEKNDEHSDDSFSEPEELQDDSSDEYKPGKNENDSESSEEETIPIETATPPIIDDSVNPLNETAKVEKRKKRRKPTPKMWKRNVQKKLRQSGEEYTNSRGQIVAKKHLRTVDCSKCRFRCNENFPEEQREKLFQEFYQLADVSKQRMYISNLVCSNHVKRPRETAVKHKALSRSYWLRNSAGKDERVCLKFFAASFDVRTNFVKYTLKNVSPITAVHLGGDKRTGQTPHNLTSPDDVNFLMQHIDSFPRVPSHYCRRESRREYLGSELNLSIMYRLYVEKCLEHNRKAVGQTLYRNLFADHEPPLSFYSPKKDQCPLCNVHKQLVADGIVHEVEIDKTNFICDEDDDLNVEEEMDEVLQFVDSDSKKFELEYKKHKQREYASLSMRDEDKKQASSDCSFRALSFDLQAILQLPYAAENQLYYVRKLNVYNFTIYDSSDKSGHCFFWDEINGSKGSNEIASCLIEYLKSLPRTVKHVATFSDTCGGQNRNRNVIAAMLYTVQTIDNLDTIDLKFMESGHSYLDADSMHARIEECRHHKRIYTPREYGLIMQSARLKPAPYCVNHMKFDDFYDWKSYSTKTCHNVKNISNSSSGDKVQWLKIKWFRFEKSRPNIVQFKYNLYAPAFLEFDVCGNNGPKRCRTRAQNKSGSEAPKAAVIPDKAYQSLIPISDLKKRDLLEMLRKKIIPSDYAHFYENLPVPIVENKKKTVSKKRKNEDDDDD